MAPTKGVPINYASFNSIIFKVIGCNGLYLRAVHTLCEVFVSVRLTARYRIGRKESKTHPSIALLRE